MNTQGRERALVVDDNPAALFAVSAVVDGMGFEVDEADGPLAALALFDSKRYDLVVSDIRMPGDMNGVQLAQILHQKNADLPIILMTGYDEHINDGTQQFVVLRKPFEARELKAAITPRRARDA
ncbi:MAG: response regulator [Rhodospirillaceae bacterium]